MGNASKLRLGPPVPSAELAKIRRHLHLNCNKWDTQVGDTAVISGQALIIPSEEWTWMCHSAEQLAEETTRAEAALLDAGNQKNVLGMPSPLSDVVFLRKPPRPRPAVATRAMRFDFHPTAEGWRVSEINSDFPGGWTEATELPKLYRPFYAGMELPASPLDAWSNSMKRLTDGGRVALLSAPGFLEDQQVIFAFMRTLEACNIPCSVIQQPSDLAWGSDGSCAQRWTGQPIRAVVRFFQLEWLCRMKSKSGWKELLQAQTIPVSNPIVSALSESKRFLLSFQNSSASPTWRTLFPESRDPRDVGPAEWGDWVLKAAYSNAGDAVYICGAYSNNERKKLVERALREPLKWVAQRRFETLPVESAHRTVHPCVGVYVVDGRAAGAYVRLSADQVTNGSAKEAPLLIEQSI